MTERLGRIVRYSDGWNIVTVPVYVPLQLGVATRQRTVSVTLLNGGPQEAKFAELDDRLTLVGVFTLVWITISSTEGAHLKESPALPEPLAPPLPENVMVSGFIAHRLLGELLEAKPTAA
jgi:hypothetical protein